VKMPDLKNQFFNGPTHLLPQRRQQLITNAFGAGLADTIIGDGWDGRAPTATITLNVSADGCRVTSSHFALWGDLAGNNIEVPACKLWEGVTKGTVLHIRDLKGSAFTFPGGQLHSNFLDQASIDVSYSRAGQPILPTDWAAENIDQLSLRAVCYLDKLSNKRGSPRIKYTILATPMTAAALAELCGHTQHVAWPGIKVLEGTAKFHLAAPPGEWAAPVYPFLCVKDRAPGAANQLPPPDHMLYAMAELMRTAALPTSCTTREVMTAKGQALLEGTSDPETRGPTITWPPVERPAADRGNRPCNVLSVSQTRPLDSA